ncbi:MAG: EcsC family protein [Myxococcales bacterium]
MLPQVAKDKLAGFYLDQIGRARKRVDDLRSKYPSAEPSEMAQRLIDQKKAWASTGGALSGLFGLISVPADIAFVTALQLALIIEIALVYRTNLKSARARGEVLEVLGYSNGADTVNLASRAGPKLFARAAEKMLAKTSLATLGRAVPVVAAPVVAWLNNKDIQRAGEAAVRFYGTMRQLPRRPSTV